MTEEVEFDLDLDTELDAQGIIIPNALDTFYEKEFFFSYSSLKLLLDHPPAFAKKYINKVYEEKLDKHLINGKLIHALILEPDTIGENFIVTPLTTPTDRTREIIHNTVRKYYERGDKATTNLQDYEDFILAELVRYNLHQSLANDKTDKTLTGDKKRLAKMFTEENCSYFKFMCTRGNKSVVDQPQMDYCKKSAEVIKSNERLCQLMGINKTDGDDHTIINEQLYFIPLKKYSFGLKGVIDNIHIDHTSKIIYINDLKTTSRGLADFPEAVSFFMYWIQAIIYLQLVGQKFSELIYNREYEVEFRFIVIDKFLQTYAFKVGETTLHTWLDSFNKKLVEANYHYSNKSFDLPYAFATGQVIL